MYLYFHVCKDFHLDFYFNFRNILLYGTANSNTSGPKIGFWKVLFLIILLFVVFLLLLIPHLRRMHTGLRRISRNCCEIALSFQAVIFIVGNIFHLEIEIFRRRKKGLISADHLSFRTINVGKIWKFEKLQGSCWAHVEGCLVSG